VELGGSCCLCLEFLRFFFKGGGGGGGGGELAGVGGRGRVAGGSLRWRCLSRRGGDLFAVLAAGVGSGFEFHFFIAFECGEFDVDGCIMPFLFHLGNGCWWWWEWLLSWELILLLKRMLSAILVDWVCSSSRQADGLGRAVRCLSLQGVCFGYQQGCSAKVVLSRYSSWERNGICY